MENPTNNHDIVIYQADNGAIQLRSDTRAGTIWATQKQMAQVFDVTPQNITLHLKKIYADNELEQKATCKESLHVQKEGNRHVSRKVKAYNLDVMIAVGYRINSVVGTRFRQWATKTLKQHITRGYTVNRHLLDKKRISAEQIISDIRQLAKSNTQIQLDDVLELVKSFTHTWFSLQSYDEGELPAKGICKQPLDIEASDLYPALAQLKKELQARGEATDLFAREKDAGELAGIVGNVMQSVFGEDAYPSIEEKAAHLLYFIVKNHPFSDGNKRSGAFSFIWFLQQAGFPLQDHLNPNTLTTLTLLIAESDPRQKEQMVGLVLQLLREKG